MKKTYAYVDGSNLYYGLLRNSKNKWLDLHLFISKLLRPNHELVKIKYFASRVIDKSPDHHKSGRQDKYFDALANRSGVEIFEGRYREQRELLQPVSEPCISCDERRDDGRVKVARITEKMTDVNIACAMLTDAFEHNADVLVLITGDSDLANVLKIAKYNAGVPVLVFNPQRSICNELRRYASYYKNLTPEVADGCSLPDSFEAIDGSARIIRCPDAWR